MSGARCGPHVEITRILQQNQRGERGRLHLTIPPGCVLPVWDQDERGSHKPGFFWK